MSAPSTLLIQRGDLPSLVLLLMQPDPTKVIAWHPEERTAVEHKRRACAESLAQARGAAGFIVSAATVGEYPEFQSDGVADRFDDQHLETRILLDAAFHAKRIGCTRILSPRIAGPDHARASRALEQSLLIVDLIELERESPELLIDLPIVERSDTELVELAMDLGAPMTSFWPCEHGNDEPCGSCAECHRWIGAFDDARVAWPFELAGAANLHGS